MVEAHELDAFRVENESAMMVDPLRIVIDGKEICLLKTAARFEYV